jgi:hypothetical protein
MLTQIQQTVSQYSTALRQLRQIRCSVSATILQTLVVSLVLARLDFGNGVLVSLPTYLMRRLQSCSCAADFQTEAFPVAGPQVWNVLPEEVTSAQSLSIFRQRLETFLLQFSFPTS